jgi:hypothetical protein
MYKILQLTVNETNVLDEIIRIYKLPLEVCTGDPESDYIVDLETEENYNLYNGVMEIISAMNCDNRALFEETLSIGEKDTFYNICNELGIDNSRQRIEALERTSNRIEMELPDKRFKLVAELYESMPGHKEIDVLVIDENTCVVQDIVRVSPMVEEHKPDKTILNKDNITTYLYEDEYDEDYTRKTIIGIYKEHLEED